jgi:hypothetical protein
MRSANHIHISASRDNQTAKELIIDGKRQGAFTCSLLKTLYSTGGLISYKNLVDTAGVMVKNIVADQSPDINVNGDYSETEKDKIFLSNTNSVTDPKYAVFHDPAYGWCIRASVIHNVTEGDIVLIDESVHSKVIQRASADFSVISGADTLVKTKIYRASVIRQPNNPATFSFAPGFRDSIRNLIQSASDKLASPFISIRSGPGQFIIRSMNNENFITLPGNEKPVFQPLRINSVEEAIYFLERTEIISRWNNLLELNNKAGTLGADDYKIELYKCNNAGNYEPENFEKLLPSKDPYEFYYQESGKAWLQPAFRLSITNTSHQPLWVTCVYMEFDYGIIADYFPPVPVAPKQTAWLSFREQGLTKDVIKLQVDKKYTEKGYNDISEYLKLFISTEQITTNGLQQKGVELPALRARTAEEVALKGIGGEKEAAGKTVEWKTETLALRIIKPLPVVDIVPGHNLALQGIIIQSHQSLQASASLSSSAEINRSANGPTAPHEAKRNSYLQPFDLLSSPAARKSMDILELFNVNDPGSVSIHQPLVIIPAATRSAKEETVLPIGFDVENGLYYPLGYTNEDGHIIINALPEETSSDSAITKRSFTGSIKIYFQKVIGQKLGFKYEYPRLAIATVSDLLEVSYEDDPIIIKERVSKATSIVLFIHGIIGDTESMVKSIKAPLDASGDTIETQYDLILAFDYENLNTEIELTADLLMKKLIKYGFGTNNKVLTIIAHSMGGLVSRWFIEKLGGNSIVKELRMYGTPNNGTPWADIRDMAETFLTFAINGAAFLKPWMFLISAVGKLAGGTQVCLKQMDSKTGIFDKLNDGTDPGIPYVIVAGNTQKIIVDYEKTVNLLMKLIKRLKTRGVYATLDLLLFRNPNDIAVTSKSISEIPYSADWLIPPVTSEIASDHISYFEHLTAQA